MNNDSALVSIIMTSYNNASYIDEAIKSILAQTYANIELIIADDCSSDKSPEIIEEYRKLYPDIIKPIFNKMNLGITKNVNLALSNATGKYIAFFSADDIFHPSKIEKQVRFMDSNPVVTVTYHDVILFDSSSRVILYKMSDRYVTPSNVTSTYILKQGTFFSILSCMIRREAFPPYFCDEAIPDSSDIFMVIECLKNSNDDMVYLPEVLAYYRRHNNSFTHVNNRILLIKELEIVEHVKTKYPDMKADLIDRTSLLYFMCSLRALMDFRPIQCVKFLIQHMNTRFMPLECLMLVLSEIRWRTKAIWRKKITPDKLAFFDEKLRDK